MRLAVSTVGADTGAAGARTGFVPAATPASAATAATAAASTATSSCDVSHRLFTSFQQKREA